MVRLKYVGAIIRSLVFIFMEVKTLKIFLSLGSNNRNKTEAMKFINKAKELIIKSVEDNTDIEFIHNYDYQSNNKVEWLGEAIKKMSHCDVVFFINDFMDYPVSTIEYTICFKYGIEHHLLIVK